MVIRNKLFLHYTIVLDIINVGNIYNDLRKNGGEKMRKQGLILVIATLMAVILCGAVSAADSSDVGGGAGLPDVIRLMQVWLIPLSTLM